MKRTIIRAALAAFLLFQLGTATAVPIIFKTNQSILVRTPAGVVAKPGIGALLATVAGVGGAAVANGSFPVSVGSASVPVGVAKTYAGGKIAAKAADLIMSRTALGLLATLALPYVIDQATDTLMRQSGTPDSPPGQYCAWTYSLCPGQSNYPGYLATTTTQAGTDACALLSKSLLGITGPNGSGEYVYTCSGGNQGVIRVYSPTCTAPSTYDAATGMCVGSAINEPANAETLAADIEATFSDNPTFPKVVLDTVLDNDQEPADGVQEIEMPSPQTVPGESKTTTKQYFDPATSHPVTEETTEQTDYKVEKTGPNQLDVKPTTTTTINITDNVTNTTTTTTNITETTPSEATTQPQDETDYTFSAAPPEYDPTIDSPDKTPLPPMLDSMKGQVQTWASSVGIEATAGECSMQDQFQLGGQTGTAGLSFCAWEPQFSAIGAIILAFASLYGGFIILGVKE